MLRVVGLFNIDCQLLHPLEARPGRSLICAGVVWNVRHYSCSWCMFTIVFGIASFAGIPFSPPLRRGGPLHPHHTKAKYMASTMPEGRVEAIRSESVRLCYI